jgi:hypothetical protein
MSFFEDLMDLSFTWNIRRNNKKKTTNVDHGIGN